MISLSIPAALLNRTLCGLRSPARSNPRTSLLANIGGEAQHIRAKAAPPALAVLERVEAFTEWLHSGVHSYSYYARATTPGRFTAAPAKAEEMYAPETFGRSGSDQVVVEP